MGHPTDVILFCEANAIMQMRLFLGLGFLLVSAGVIGCGSGKPATPPAPVITPANLGGNWLLAGALPSNAQTTAVFGLSATFDVAGSQATGVVEITNACASTVFAESGTVVVTGPIAEDGSFTLTLPIASSTPSPPLTVTVQGKVPSSAGVSWAGSYNITNTCFNPSTGASQPVTLTGPIESTSMPLLNGTYAGTIPISTGTGTANVSMKLQQGGLSTNPTTGAQGPYTNAILAGTISVQEPSCSLTGTTQGATIGSATYVSTVYGEQFEPLFLMSDGSEILGLGDVTSTNASSLAVSLLPRLSSTVCPLPNTVAPVTLTLQ